MSIAIPFEETEELVELSLEERNSLSHGSMIEPAEYSQNLCTNVDFCENIETMSSFKKLYDAAMASVTMFLTKIKCASARQYQVKALTMVRTKCLTRRSARSHRSKSAAKSAASNSNNADGGDPEPAPSVFPRTGLKPTFSFYAEFANRPSQEDA
ncbi:hypothetical protein ACDY94_20740 [Escherichia coli]|uniref:Uncharacterized protein n=1 Tax=Atlantibacter subterraneus TaxID=255519 RepID=A0ABU4E5B2_9ENTR|nr:hypothetical protein [Atlantibacter subterranea]MDV7024315.1 hypothetical protein [Atlantibacter subterranea]MDZ5667411.1 hypothetical protein [Atlantibacter hermannii]QFH70221.1 hypothetical protein FR762_10960 [Enterobacter sp. E76]